jgi:hypothetical protein
MAYESIVRALKGCYGDRQLAAAYWVQLKTRTQLISESLQDLAAAVKQLAQQAPVRLPVDFIQREVANAFIDRTRDQEEKQHLLMEGNRSLIETLNQAVKLEVEKVAARPPVRLREVMRTHTETWLPPAERRRNR